MSFDFEFEPKHEIGYVSAVYGDPAHAYDVQVGDRRDPDGNLCPYGSLKTVGAQRLKLNDSVTIIHEQVAQCGTGVLPMILGRSGIAVGPGAQPAAVASWPLFGLNRLRQRNTGQRTSSAPILEGRVAKTITTGTGLTAARCTPASVFLARDAAGGGAELVKYALFTEGADPQASAALPAGTPEALGLEGSAAYLVIHSA